MNKKKIIIIVLSSLFIIFMIRNLIWYLNFNKYENYISNEYELYVKSYGKTLNGYSYTIKQPEFYSFTGNFAINNNADISIIIWPELFMKGDMRIGMELVDAENNHGYRFYVDKELNYMVDKKNNFTEEEITQIQNLLDKKKEEIGKMYRLAKKEWDLK
ncbi:hypothetical protein C8E03_10112 [Lachnotalea glycerini]|uniref:Uncharacterized protein n=1 Tax=Lachnotalea glycerini TaxID=1763509 RepID=A0A318EWF3_9FIRM|nr:hypothetical protein [Lachnotalea glycerini]PXV95384.1 hypothetical protein C8E03_10112 [Lachnotalea glycerini]